MLLLAFFGWLYLAPPQIGGRTTYVTTHGISMEPLFHTGDLALVRPADHYAVGEVVAYHSTLLHEVVLHRIVGRDGDRYVFKGDNNHFLDPVQPTRAELVGRLWLHIRHGGLLIAWLHSPPVLGGLAGGAALLLLLGTEGKRRRRDRRRQRGGGPVRPSKGDRSVTSSFQKPSRQLKPRQILTASAVAAVAFLALGVLAFSRPETKTVTVTKPYTQHVSFGYQAQVPAETVYPSGLVTTGQPIYLHLVHRLAVTVGYHFSAAARHQLTGTLGVLGTLTSPTGWRRTIQLAAPTHFAGDRASANMTIDLTQLQSLIDQVTALIGGTPVAAAYATDGTSTLTLSPEVHISGKLAGQPVETGFSPPLSFQLGGLQLLVGATSSSTGKEQNNDFTPSQSGAVAVSATAQDPLSVFGHKLPVGIALARWIALAGIVLAAASALLARRRQLREFSDPTAQIKARYGHLIIPAAGLTHSPDRPPIDVDSIDALAQLAEHGERLILHDHRDGADSYFIDDAGTIYRYRPPARRPPATPSAVGA